MQPVYDYLGYRLVEVKYQNKKQMDNTYVNISMYGDELKNDIYSFYIKITTDFDSNEDYFIFEAAFNVNDKSWFEKLDENTRKAVFFGIVFPYVREKIFSITTDLTPGLFIPVLDLRQFDLSKEIRLIKNK